MSDYLLIMCGFQSQGGFWNNNVSAYREAALVAASYTRTGRSELVNEIERRLPGKNAVHIGEVAPGTPTMGVGGTSFVADTLDPTVSPGDDTPLSGNTDARLHPSRGQVFLAALDAQLAARAPAAERIIVFMFHYTHDLHDSTGQSAVNQARALSLWHNFVGAKLAATGKPYRMYIVPMGFSDRPNPWFRMMIMEAMQHIAVNGRRSTRADLASFPVVPHLYIAGGAQCMVSFDRARVADNVAPAADEAHQSQASSIRLARMLAVEFSRWLNPAAAQEYDGIPYVQNAFFDAANSRVRVRVKITAGNRLVWVPRPAEDAALATLEGGSPFPGGGHTEGGAHVLLHAHRAYQPGGWARARPERIPATSIAVDNAPAASGFAFLDIGIAAGTIPTRAACVSIQPAAAYRAYWRIAESIPPADKFLAGLREEAGSTPYTVNAACADVLASPGPTTGHTWLAVRSAVNVPVHRTDPGAAFFG